MKLEIKNILESYFGESRQDDSCPVCVEVDGERSPLFAIACFMDEHHLTVSARNLELTWEYVCGGNKALKNEVLDLAAASRLNDSVASDLFDKYLNTDVGSEIDRIVLEAIHQIHRTTKIIDDGNKESQKCEDNLLEHADNISVDSGDVGDAIQKLLSLSRLMVESTRKNREQIHETNKKLADLKGELEQARNEADFDQLTKLPNRRKFERALDDAFQSLIDDGQSLVVVLADIDNFKKINDTFGHECGDRVLRLVADELSSLSAIDCHISRYGGEEFALIFEGYDIDKVFDKVDVCREALSQRSLVDVESGNAIGQVTFSAGVAECLTGDTKRSILRKSDLALYQAKSEGRNAVLKYSNDR
ncbi:MAG: GGDEF domain-containing protein [Parasphingorhabdus sp.]